MESLKNQLRNLHRKLQGEFRTNEVRRESKRAEIQATRDTPLDIQLGLENLDASILKISEQFEGRRFERPSLLHEGPSSLRDSFQGSENDLLGMMCFFAPSLVREEMTTVMTKYLVENPGLSDEVRAVELARLEGELGTLEAEGRAIIQAAEKEGLELQ